MDRNKIGTGTVEQEFKSLYQIETKIRAALHSSLPGSIAHLSMATRPRRGWHPGYIPSDARSAAGLVLLYPCPDDPHVLLTVRASVLPQHSGQVSFPGGRLERGETISQAALREAAEEVGIESCQVRVIGLLSALYIPVSGFALHPVIGISDQRPTLQAASNEVGRILEVPFSNLIDRTQPRLGVRWRHSEQHEVPYFELCDERVWGATAMVLAELLVILGMPPSDPWAL